MEDSLAEPWRSCERVAEALRNEISPDEYANVVDYIKYNEWGLSMETLIDYLGDREATITPEQYRLISDAMVEMGMEDSPRLATARSLIAPEK